MIWNKQDIVSKSMIWKIGEKCMSNKVEFRHITKYFPGVKALEDICFEVNSGEVLAFMGENGAGKSTLLKILNGDYQPTAGEYLIDKTYEGE